jgi:methyl-accepting chemotaxis protein
MVVIRFMCMPPTSWGGADRMHATGGKVPGIRFPRARAGTPTGVDLTSILLAPVQLPLRAVRGIEELTAELRQVRAIAEHIDGLLPATLEAITLLTRVAESVDVTGQQIIVGGADLTDATRTQERRTRELIDGGEELTEVSKQLEADLQIIRAALPRILRALDTVDRLEEEVETVADTIEPLQGAAERVGRVTRRLSRTS